MSQTPITQQVDQLPVTIYPDQNALGQAAAEDARQILQAAIRQQGVATIILATGNSQLSFLHALRNFRDIDWSKVTIFHMDEYVGIAPHHPASFPLFLRQHIIDAIQPAAFHAVPSQANDVEQACRDYEALLRRQPIDMVAMGWGENGHIAFNDPPYADFDDPVWVKVVQLAEASRRQQVGEGHFPTLADVPTHAITLTVPALLAPRHILCIVPEARKAQAVHDCLTLPISEDHPGSILRTVNNARLYLDQDSAKPIL
ncbi:MAG: glucosamine-6-phosphate deaminase [Caldilineaceae bacterium]